MTIWICGNSHTGALGKGLAAARARNPILENIRMFAMGSAWWESTAYSEIRNGRVEITQDAYKENFTSNTKRTSLAPDDVYGFVLGTHTALTYNRKMWRGAAPSDLATGRLRPVSTGLLDAIIRNDQFGSMDFLDKAHKSGCRFFVISSPPPRLDHPAILAGVSTDVVLRIDTVSRAIFSAWCEERSITLIPPPREAVRPDGFLDPIFAKEPPDPHHANGDYGTLMMVSIAEHLSSLEGTTAHAAP